MSGASTSAIEPEAAHIGLRHVRTYRGPNPFCGEPCVVAAFDFDPETTAFLSANCARIAGLQCAIPCPPGTASQSDDPAEAIADFLAAWTLALLNKAGGFLHAAGTRRLDGQLHIYVGTHNEQLTLAAMRLAAELLDRAETVDADAIQARLDEFRRLAGPLQPDFQIRFLLEAAHAADVPYLPFFPGHRLWQFGWGANGRVFFESEPDGDSAIGWKIARDKLASKAVFDALGIPNPACRVVHREADLPAAASAVGWPCVVKPAAAGRARGVTTDIDRPDLLLWAFREARAVGKGPVMIERQVEGDVHRIDVVRGKVRVIRRFAVEVTGDGRSSMAELIGAANREIEARNAVEPARGPIAIDDRLRAQLHRQGLSLDAAPEAGRRVMLNRVALLGGGASYVDATARAHPDVITMARLLASSFRLEVCGIDYVTRDISRSCAEDGAVLEINTTPGVRAAEGAGASAVEIGRDILGEGIDRIPVTLVLAEGSDFERLAGELRFAVQGGWVVGGLCGLGSLVLAGPDGEHADAQPPALADLVERLLRNPLARDLAIVATPAEIAQTGIPIDRFSRILVCPVALEPAWRDVLAPRTGNWLDLPDADAVLRDLQPRAG